MAYDIYGNRLLPGHCEVHPHVHETYPCSICYSEMNADKARQQQEQEPQERMYTRAEVIKLVEDKVQEYGADAQGDIEYTALFGFPDWFKQNI
jgi:hypothetical protein